MKTFYTYLHCRPDGTPFYVGKGAGNRCRDFTSGRNQHHKRVIAKHGPKNIGVYAFACASEEQAFADEVQQIAQLRGEGFRLVNICGGGQGPAGRTFSAETRTKMSASHVGVKIAAETLTKRSATNRGSKRSAETRLRISLAQKGKPKSPELRAKLAVAAKGRKHTLEARRKVSASLIGNKRAAGHKHTPEHLAMIAATKKARGAK